MDKEEIKNQITNFKEEIAIPKIKERNGNILQLIHLIKIERSSRKTESLKKLLTSLIKLENEHSKHEYIYHSGTFYNIQINKEIVNTLEITPSVISLTSMNERMFTDLYMSNMNEKDSMKIERNFLFTITIITMFALVFLTEKILPVLAILLLAIIIKKLAFSEKTSLLGNKYDKEIKKYNNESKG